MKSLFVAWTIWVKDASMGRDPEWLKPKGMFHEVTQELSSNPYFCKMGFSIF